jgi:hypothetical protein
LFRIRFYRLPLKGESCLTYKQKRELFVCVTDSLNPSFCLDNVIENMLWILVTFKCIFIFLFQLKRYLLVFLNYSEIICQWRHRYVLTSCFFRPAKVSKKSMSIFELRQNCWLIGFLKPHIVRNVKRLIYFCGVNGPVFWSSDILRRPQHFFLNRPILFEVI